MADCAVTPVTGDELYNLLQEGKNWPSGGPPVLFDVRGAASRHIRGAHLVRVTEAGEIEAPPRRLTFRLLPRTVSPPPLPRVPFPPARSAL